jgi:hypothetical protein
MSGGLSEHSASIFFAEKNGMRPFPAHTRRTRPTHLWTEAGAYHRNESGGRSSMSAGHRQRARMINDRPLRSKGWARADLKPRVENSDLGASVQPTILVHGRIRHAKDPLVHVRTRHASKGLWVVNQLVGYPGRPRGGLIIVPSRHLFQQVPTPPPLMGGDEDFARAMLPPQANTLCLWVIRWRNATCAFFL